MEMRERKEWKEDLVDIRKINQPILRYEYKKENDF